MSKHTNDDEENEEYEEKKRGYGSGFLAGILMGGLAGAAVALIMAPHSGPQTRALLMDKGYEIKDQVDEKVHHARSQAEGVVEDVKGKARKIENNVQAATRAAQAAWRDQENTPEVLAS